MIAIADSVKLAVRDFEKYVHGSEERLLEAARGNRVYGSEVASVLKKVKNENKL